MTVPTSVEQRLAEAEAVFEALRRQEVDAIVGRDEVMLLRLRNAELALRAAAERDRFRLKLSETLRTLSDPAAIEVAATRVLGEYLRASRVHFAELTPDSASLIVRADYHDCVGSVAGEHRIEDYPARLMEEVIAGRTVVLRDVASDARCSDADKARSGAMSGMASYLVVPLSKQGKTAAVLWVHRAQPHQWSEDEIRLVEEAAERSWSAAEHARAEAALRQSEAQFRTMSDQLPLMVWLNDAQGQQEFVNQTFCGYFGVSREEMRADRWRMLTDPEDGATYVEEFFRSVREKRPFHGIVRARRADGEWRWLESWASPQFGPEGQFLGHVGTSLDITERKQAEDALRESEERLRLAMHAANAGSWEADPEGGEFIASDRALALHGLAPGTQLNHKRALAAVHPKDRPAVEEALRHTLETGAPFRVELRTRRADGSVRWLLSQGELQEGKGHRRLVGLVQDITERKRAEAALHESEARFRTIAEALPGLVFVHGSDGRNTFVNRGFCEFAGRDPEHLLEDRYADLINPEDAQAAWTAWHDAVSEGQAFEGEYRFRRRDGAWRWHLVRTVPFKSADGSIMQWIGTATDVTERREAVEALKQADRRKDEFLAVLAHELRNPLAPLRNGLELLRLTRGEPEQAEQARSMMERQVRHMTRLIDDLLDISRISSGKLELKKQPLDVVEALRSALETSRPLLASAGHELLVDLPDTPLMVDGDLVRLAQVFANLLNNAARYTQPRGHVSMRARAEGNDVVVRIEDTGVGIPADMLERVFEPFIQIEEGGRRVHGGLGLGLALARRLVELHGGVIHAQSAGAGQGSSFIVRLPAAAASAAPTELCSSATAAPKVRVLVVDDNADSAQSLGLLLQLKGHEVIIVNDGPSALEAAVRHRPDLVILDIGMPGMDGYEVARRLRSVRSHEKVSIVALTGYGQHADRTKSAEAGLDAHLVKPLEPSALEAVIASLSRESS
jgi:PAS domain S-box-containing protein